MRYFDRAVLWLRALFRRSRVETEMEKEMRVHLEMEIEYNIRQGMSAEEARRAARVAFGGVDAAKEGVRDERGTQWLDHTLSDVRYAMRGFRKHPIFTIGVVVVIALGIGPNAAIFSIIDERFISPLPYADGNRMVQLLVTSSHGMFLVGATSGDVERWHAAAHTVDDITMVESHSFELGDSSRVPTQTVDGSMLTPGALAFVGARPILGRDIVAADTLANATPVMLVGYSLWQRLFDGRAQAIGQSLIVDGQRVTIIGVLPEGFSLPFTDHGELFPALRGAGKTRRVTAFAKLKRGLTVEQANGELASLFAATDLRTNADVPRLQRAVDQTNSGTRHLIFVMFAAVTIVLLIACANVANLMLARAWERQREFAVRTAMGAGRVRLVRQMLTESLLVAIVGAMLGAALAWATLRLLATASSGSFSSLGAVHLRPLVMLWGVGLTLFVAIAFGLAPALFAARDEPSEALKAGARSASLRASSRHARSTLMITEIALSATLLIVCGLLVRSIVAAQRFDVGIETHGLWGMHVQFDKQTMPDSIARASIIEDMLRRVRAVPGVTSATMAITLPPDFTYGIGVIEIDGVPRSPNDTLGVFSIMLAQPDYFGVTGTRLVAGRTFELNHSITDRSTSPEIVINESFARRWWPNGNAIGARLKPKDAPTWWRVVGIARDVSVPMSRRERSGIQIYEAAGLAQRSMTLLVRSPMPMAATSPAIISAVHDASARLHAQPAVSAESLVSDARGMQRYLLTILGAFGIIALVLTAVGLHAVVAYSVGQRTREIGVRMALGAQARNVRELVFGQSLRLVVVGLAVGVFAGGIAGRAVRALLYEIGVSDPVTMAAVTGLLMIVALMAAYWPARRATMIDPIAALRAE